MGNFANTLFSVLLGWVQRAVAWLWSLAGTDGASGLLGWVMDNWLMLAVGLCLLGLAADLVVYIIRWQPYRVWRFFSRKDRQEEAGEDELSPDEPMQWVYATGEAAPEPAPAPQAPVRMVAEHGLPEEPERPAQRVFAARDHRTGASPDASAYVQQGYRQAYFPPQWTGENGRSNDGGTHG